MLSQFHTTIFIVEGATPCTADREEEEETQPFCWKTVFAPLYFLYQIEEAHGRQEPSISRHQ
jgi:hypothetical protein